MLAWGFEDTFENTQWRKFEQMHPMWLCIFWGRPFEETFENTQWRKVEQMQPMWVCILSGKPFEDTFEYTLCREAKLKLHMESAESFEYSNIINSRRHPSASSSTFRQHNFKSHDWNLAFKDKHAFAILSRISNTCLITDNPINVRQSPCLLDLFSQIFGIYGMRRNPSHNK